MCVRGKVRDGILPGRTTLWTSALVCLLAMQTVASAFLGRSFLLTLTSDSIDLLLIFSAFLVSSLDSAGGNQRARPFWTLLANYWGIRIFVQLMWMYFEVVLRKEVPNPFIG